MQKVQSYEIIERLGVGGMGIVYKAKHLFRNEVVAIKSLSPQYAIDPEFRRRFINEASILHNLDHKNIVRIIDFIEEPENLHLIMEFVDGRTLDKIIGTEVGPIPYDKALPIFIQILEGVNYAHLKGVIHRDLKPSNIMVTKNNKIKITDFGIARLEGQTGMTKTGTKMGTIYYMSPEQVRGEHVNEQADIYSLGITLYEMLAGRLPFNKTETISDFMLMNKIVSEELKDPREFYPYILEWLVNIIYKATAKDKSARIKYVDEFISMLTTGKDAIIEKPVDKQPSKQITVPAEQKPSLEAPKQKIESPKPKVFIEPEMVLIEGGSFQRESSNALGLFKKTHTVTLDSFYIGKYPVTQKGWKEIMGSNPSHFKGDNLPVESVSWTDAQNFLTKLNKNTGQKYRLPTEAEWEYAARGGNKSKGYKYSGSNYINEVAWHFGNSKLKTHSVGSKNPNEIGIYDMSGNVCEWCSDWYDGNYYKTSPRNNPQGPSSGAYRVLRGGSWGSSDSNCRSAYCLSINSDSRNPYFGFRIARDL